MRSLQDRIEKYNVTISNGYIDLEHVADTHVVWASADVEYADVEYADGEHANTV